MHEFDVKKSEGEVYQELRGHVVRGNLSYFPGGHLEHDFEIEPTGAIKALGSVHVQIFIENIDRNVIMALPRYQIFSDGRVVGAPRRSQRTPIPGFIIRKASAVRVELFGYQAGIESPKRGGDTDDPGPSKR